MDVNTHMGCFSGNASSGFWLGAFQLLFRRNSKDLLGISHALVQETDILLVLFKLDKLPVLCLPHFNVFIVYYLSPGIVKLNITIFGG